MKYVLYNKLSGNGKNGELAERYKESIDTDAALVDMCGISDYDAFLSSVGVDDDIVIIGGDGTLNRFVNATACSNIPCSVYYMPAGTGNDFATDVGHGGESLPFDITDYIKGLPTVTVNGEDYKFVNGVGYGIDGYCCEVGDKMKAAGKQPNYGSIAVKGLLFHYKPTDAVVIVDGVEHEFKKVWLAPTMFGRHYGGGMIPTPEQSRDTEELSVMLFYGSGKLRTLLMFPSIFKGEHVKHKKNVTVLRGKEITVKFSRPTPLQIDGETILDVLEYTARAGEKSIVTA